MTPFDVVKVRLQTQQRSLLSQRCFLYCNGLMDHICNCAAATVNNGNATQSKAWYNRPVPVHLNGTIVSLLYIIYYSYISLYYRIYLWKYFLPDVLKILPTNTPPIFVVSVLRVLLVYHRIFRNLFLCLSKKWKKINTYLENLMVLLVKF